jgi:uncharacterized DUF497 family protein
MATVRFVWDPRKAAANLRKHGVSFEEAETAFADELAAYYPDTLLERDSSSSDTHVGVASSTWCTVVHAEVTDDSIRIISARKATRHEQTHYEND